MDLSNLVVAGNEDDLRREAFAHNNMLGDSLGWVSDDQGLGIVNADAVLEETESLDGSGENGIENIKWRGSWERPTLNAE